MKTIQLEVKDDYLDSDENELLSRVDDIKSNRVQTISRDELFKKKNINKEFDNGK